jgi:hypothetical protein
MRQNKIDEFFERRYLMMNGNLDPSYAALSPADIRIISQAEDALRQSTGRAVALIAYDAEK